eukprot:UN14294
MCWYLVFCKRLVLSFVTFKPTLQIVCSTFISILEIILEIHLQDACADSLLYLSNYGHRVLMADNSICRLHNVFFIILQTFLNRLIQLNFRLTFQLLIKL